MKNCLDTIVILQFHLLYRIHENIRSMRLWHLSLGKKTKMKLVRDSINSHEMVRTLNIVKWFRLNIAKLFQKGAIHFHCYRQLASFQSSEKKVIYFPLISTSLERINNTYIYSWNGEILLYHKLFQWVKNRFFLMSNSLLTILCRIFPFEKKSNIAIEVQVAPRSYT